VEAEDAQLEAVLSLGIAVAAGAIAIEPAQHRNQIVLEMKREWPRRSGDDDADARLLALGRDVDVGRAVANRLDEAGRADDHDARIVAVIAGLASEIAGPAIFAGAGDEQRVARTRSLEAHRGRLRRDFAHGDRFADDGLAQAEEPAHPPGNHVRVPKNQ